VKEVHCNENSLSEHSRNHSDFETNEESINSSNESELGNKQKYGSQNKKRTNFCTSKSNRIHIIQKIIAMGKFYVTLVNDIALIYIVYNKH